MNAINYQLSFPNPQNHYCQVKIEFEAPITNPIVGMPVWAPGSYLVREYSKNLEEITSNQPIKKVMKNQWQITAKKGDKVVVSYLVYANEVSVRTSFITDEHAFINPVGTFMYVKGLENTKHIVDITLPTNWKKVACGLINEDNKKQIVAHNYDLLVDAPIEVGNHDEFTFEAAGVTHTVAMVGQNNADYQQLAIDMKKAVEAAINVWKELPVKRYLFIVEHVDNGGGGLEHLNSTVLMMSRNNYNQSDKYINFISLAAHEYFHLWNVKRLRPVELGPFNYDEENHTELLWFFEGFTAYYDELLLHRAGFIDKTAYLKRVTDNIEKTENRAGVKVQTLAEASYDAWIKAYRPDENSANTTISYYGKGAIVANLLDLTIIKESNGKHNLDDLMRKLYALYKSNPTKGIVETDIIKAANSMTGKDLNNFFKKLVHSTDMPDYESYYQPLGLDYKAILDSNNVHLGTNSKMTDGKLVVQSVKRNTAAYEAGIQAGDQYLAINGIAIQNITEDLKRYAIGEEITIQIVRDGLIKEIKVKLGTNPDLQISLTAIEKPSNPALNLQSHWLNNKEVATGK